MHESWVKVVLILFKNVINRPHGEKELQDFPKHLHTLSILSFCNPGNGDN